MPRAPIQATTCQRDDRKCPAKEVMTATSPTNKFINSIGIHAANSSPIKCPRCELVLQACWKPKQPAARKIQPPGCDRRLASRAPGENAKAMTPVAPSEGTVGWRRTSQAGVPTEPITGPVTRQHARRCSAHVRAGLFIELGAPGEACAGCMVVDVTDFRNEVSLDQGGIRPISWPRGDLVKKRRRPLTRAPGRKDA